MNNKNDYDKIEEAFDKLYDKYQQILLKASNTKKGEDLYGYQTRFFQAMEEGANGFKIAAKNIVDKYINGTDESVSMALKSFGAKYGGNEIKLTTYVRMADVLTQSVNKYRNDIQAKILEREKQGEVTTVGDLQGIIQEDLTNGEGTSVKYANGAKMPVGKYAAMLARTTRAETDNLAMIQQALKEGIDLLKCGTVSPTCDICSVYQGRVYSISGKDSRYPALYKTAFKSGYSIIHPNCRHSWTPYYIELYTKEQQDEDRKRSNRSFKPDTDSRAFQQTERMREEYAKGQAKMRQWNAEIVEYERMKAFYGKDMPYKTLGAFRREVRKPVKEQSATMKTWRRRVADKQLYDRWVALLGKKNMPKSFDKFEAIKYNKKEEFALLKGYKEAQQKQDIHAFVSFKTYKLVSREIDKAIVGKTFDGIQIKGKLTHFIDRVIGEYQESDYKQLGKRQGVKIIDVVDCLQSKVKSFRNNSDGSISITYKSDKCKVTLNPNTGILIQTNPNKKR